MFIENLPEEKAFDHPEKTAFKNTDTKEEISYLDFFKMSSFLADFLFRKHGINHSDIVISNSDDELFNAALFFACSSTGAIFFIKGKASKEECLSLHSKASFGKDMLFSDSLKELGYKTGAMPVSEVEIYEHDPSILIRESENHYAILPYSMILCDAISSFIIKKISSDDISFSKLDFSKEDSLSSCFLPTLIAGGTICIGNNPKDEKISICSGDSDFWEEHKESLSEGKIRHSEFIMRKIEDKVKLNEFKISKISYALNRAGLYSFRGTTITCDGIRLGIPGYSMKAKIAGINLEDIPEGIEGRLVMRGRNLFSGLYNNPKETSECFKKGWTDTGIKSLKRGQFFEITC